MTFIQISTIHGLAKSKLVAVLLGALGISAFIGARLYSNLDDAFITFQYAKNLAHGLGFVYHPGAPPVLGTTTPLFTLLLSGLNMSGADIPLAAGILGALAHGITVVLVLRLGIAWGQPVAGLFTAALYSVSMPAISASGMETPLYTLLIVLTFYLCALDIGSLWTWLCAALCMLMRIDGAFVAVALLITSIIQRTSRRRLLGGVLLYSLILIPWFAFAIWQFGSPLPNSFYAKTAHETWVSGRFSILGYYDLFGYLFGLQPFALVAPFVLVGGVAAFRRPKVRPALLWTPFFLAGYTLARLPNFLWYYVPPLFMVYFCLWLGLEEFGNALIAFHKRSSIAYLQVILLGVMVALFVLNLVQDTALQIRRDPFGRTAFENNVRRQAGLWLREHATPDQVVAAKEVGMIEYYSDLPIVDLLGLVTPDAIPYVRRRQYAQLIGLYEPAYVFITNASWDVVAQPIQQLATFQTNYEPVLSETFYSGAAAAEYSLYQRRSAVGRGQSQ